MKLPETALGGSIQNVVTEDEETAKRLIQYLKQNRFGRVTFLPLTAVRNVQEFKNLQALKEPGVIGLAHTLVQTDARYRNIMAQLLGRTLVVDQIDHAIALQRKYHHMLRIVTLEGESLNPGGSMTGGSFRNSSSLLSRNREIEELREKVEQSRKILETARAKLVEFQNDRSSCYSQLDQNAAVLQEIRVRENTARMNVEQLKAQREAAGSGLSSLRKEEAELLHQTQEIAALKEQNQTELKDSESMEKAHTYAVETYQKRLDEDRGLEAEAAKELEELHLDTASIKQKAEFAASNLKRIEGEIARVTQEQAELKISREQSESDTRSREEGIQALKQEMNLLTEKTASLEEQTAELQEKKEEQSASHKSFFGKREELSSRMNELVRVFRITVRRKNWMRIPRVS